MLNVSPIPPNVTEEFLANMIYPEVHRTWTENTELWEECDSFAKYYGETYPQMFELGLHK